MQGRRRKQPLANQPRLRNVPEHDRIETIRNTEDIGNWKRKHQIALFEELALEEAVDLSQNRLRYECLHYSTRRGV
jgi:hypothetical protein